MRQFFWIIVLVVAASAVGRADTNGGGCIAANGNNGNCQPVEAVPEVAGDTAMAAFALLSGGIAILRARRKS